MNIEMICTGEEVLAGQIVDTNAAWFGNALMDAGLEMNRRTTVGDRLSDLVEVFQERSHCADIILVNGGLGPTADDLSALAMARAMGVDLVENKQWREVLEAWFAKRNLVITASNLKQTLLPQGAVMVDNPVGTACGFRVKLNRAWLFFTPGVPHEFKEMIEHQFIPFVKSQSGDTSQVMVSKLLTLGMGESVMADTLEALHWPEGITLGYRSFSPYLELKLIARNSSQADVTKAYQQAIDVLADCVVARRHQSLASEVHSLIVESKGTLAIAESLTGGEIASQLVSLAGSSAYLKQAVVSYCNQAKIALLGVSRETIEQYSEVSLACVTQMALGAASALSSNTAKHLLDTEHCVTDYAIATSGMAGPASGHSDIPVGCVVIAVKALDNIYSQKIQLSSKRDRDYIRSMSTAIALDMLRRALININPIANYPNIKRVEHQCVKISV